MTLYDHAYVILMAIIVPLTGYIGYRRLLKRVAAGESVNRAALYGGTVRWQWALLITGLLGWVYSSRSWTAIGVRLEADLNFLIGLGLVMLAIGYLVYQVREVMTSSEEKLLELRKSFTGVNIIIPRNGNELLRFYGLSITAGIVEELLWRGFLIWYLSAYMPIWAAAIVSSIGFGLAHAYQGFSKVPAIDLVGAAFAGLYLLTGSIWLPIILHIMLDILQGRMAYEVFNRSQPTDSEFHDGNAQTA